LGKNVIFICFSPGAAISVGADGDCAAAAAAGDNNNNMLPLIGINCTNPKDIVRAAKTLNSISNLFNNLDFVLHIYTYLSPQNIRSALLKGTV
jgi:hypothetical protein